MFLRANKRFKDGKEHLHRSVVENRRVAGGRCVQKTLLYLGEINDSERSAWSRTIEAVDEGERTRQIHLFPEDRVPAPGLEHASIRPCLSRIELSRPRQWGGCWLAMELWQRHILLYDLTSTYFEVDANGPVARNSRLKAFGYSRDKRPDCLQIIIALIVTPEGLPNGYEVMRGSISDKTTLAGMLEKVAARHGRERRTWIMDRGIAMEETLGQMRAASPSTRYLVGTPKGRLTKLEQAQADKEWQEVKDDVQVKLLPRDGEVYVLARSLPRRDKESAMRRKKLKAYWARLKELQGRENLARDELLLAIGAAKEKAGLNARRLVINHLPGAGQKVTKETFRFELDHGKPRETRRHEGQYLLRSNLTGEDPEELWRNYMNLTRIEESFRAPKGDLGLRPIFHQLDARIEAHEFISFLAYCLHVTLENTTRRRRPD